MAKLHLKNLTVKAEQKTILNGINFSFETGKVYAVIGPNGHGKSTLLAAIMGDPNYEISQGKILIDNEDLSEASVDERARKGIYLCMQYPAEIAGITNLNLLKAAHDKKTSQQAKLSHIGLYQQMQDFSQKLRIDPEMMMRDVNVGFSGGEKKKNELLHLFMLKPTFAFLDEVDSGLDVDSIQAVSQLIKAQRSEKQSFIIVSHYLKLYEHLPVDQVIIIKNGQIAQVGDQKLLKTTLAHGFEHENN